MGDDIKETPNEGPNADAAKVIEKALALDAPEDESNLDTSKKEIPKKEVKEETPEEKEEVKEEEKPEPTKVDEDSLLSEVEDLRSVKGKLGEELGTSRKERDHYKKLYEDSLGKKTEKQIADEFEEIKKIQDPTKFAKAVVDLAKKEASKEAQGIIGAAQSEFKKKTDVWNHLIKKHPDLKDSNSEIYKLTDALIKARNIKMEDFDLAAGFVESQLKLAEGSKTTKEVVAGIKAKKITKQGQGGFKQPIKDTIKTHEKWDSKSAEEKSAASKMGLGPEDFEEVSE